MPSSQLAILNYDGKNSYSLMLTLKKGLALGGLAYVVFLLAMVPASLPIHYAEAKLPRGVQLTQIDGSIWQGGVVITYQNEDYRLLWELNPWELLLLQLSATFDLQNEHIALSGKIMGSPSGAGVSAVSGFIGEQPIETLARDFSVSIENPLRVVDMGLSFDGALFDNVSGVFRWQGGSVQYKAGRKPKSVQVPALKAQLGLDEEQLLLSVLTQEDESVLASINLSPEGMAAVAVRKRMLDVVGQRWGQEVDPDFVVFEVQEQLLN